MRVGVQLPEVEREVRWPEYVTMARAAEEVGFDSVWVGDHLLYRGPDRAPWDVWTVLAGLAVATERVTLGPLVACTAFAKPGLLARTAAAVDELSGGRLVLGLGAGWSEDEFRAFGLPFDRRVSRFAEAFEIVRRLLAGERVTFAGEFERVEDALLLPPPARTVPLMIGANGPRMLATTLPHVGAWNTWFDDFGNTPEGFAELSAKIGAAAERAGRDPAQLERSACVLTVVDGAARERPIPDGIPPLEGSPQQIADGLRAFAEAGADEAILVVSPITEASIRRLGEAIRLL